MKTTYNPMVLLTLLEEIKNEELDLNHPVQRKTQQFSILQKSLLVDSALRGYPIPPIYVYECSTGNYVIDGKQRLSSLMEFVNDEFALHESIKPFITKGKKEVELAGMRFSELPTSIKNSINSLPLVKYIISNGTDDEINEIFLRLNNGSPLNTSQKIKALTDSNTKKRISGIISSPLFERIANVTKTQVRKSEDETVVLQILMLTKGLFDFTKNGMMSFSKDYVYDTNDFDVIEKAVEELSVKFPDEKFKNFKKISLPMVIAAYITCTDEKTKDDFVAKVVDFFEDDNFKNQEEYKTYCTHGTSQATNVKKRYETFIKMI